MNKWSEIVLGLILLIGAIYLWYFSLGWSSFWNFGTAAWELAKGGLMWIVIFLGLILIILGISDLRE